MPLTIVQIGGGSVVWDPFTVDDDNSWLSLDDDTAIAGFV